MSANPLHYKNNVQEIIEVLSCNVIPTVSAHLIFSFGDLEKTEDSTRRFASLLFSAPIRIDMYDDEGSNLDFENETEFKRFSKKIPGVIHSRKSKYLKKFLEKESFVEAHSGESITHYVIWSYGGGVVHVLSTTPPSLEEI